MPEALRLLDGFRLGHWTDETHGTGCTVLLCPPGTMASAEVRGSSPGSRELALLAVDKKMDQIHALVLTGGSAYGLAAADGVMRWLEERGIGYRTPWGVVPIVPAAVIFDLNVGSWDVRPGPEQGRMACDSADVVVEKQGSVGAGTGATIGKWKGLEGRMRGGFGVADWREGTLVIQVLAVVNAVGDILDASGAILAGAKEADGTFAAGRAPLRPFARGRVLERTNTTLVALITNARLSKVECQRVAQRLHDGLARTIVPVHTSYDGDVTFALSSGGESSDLDLIAECGAQVAAEAIRSAVRHAADGFGVPSFSSRR
jgi:L-aminopeptidase/D-esterase-like protein